MSRRLAGCLAVLMLSASPALAQIHAELVTTGFTRPVAIVADPMADGVFFVAEEGGRIQVLSGGQITGTFLDISDQVSTWVEGGVLGMALAPDYASSGRFFVNFTDVNNNTVIARFARSADDPLVADPSSRFDILWPDGNRFITQPHGDHNGGNLQFGPDGYLYLALGDGGDVDGVGDPEHRAQDPTTVLGKMLRLDVSVPDDDPVGYVVPGDNPFVNNDPGDGSPWPLPEIWAFGFRNPWRYTFDDRALGGTGALVLGDVGQNAWEEVDYEPAGRGGRNYGWSVHEGTHDYDPDQPVFQDMALTDPILEYPHTIGRCITGGIVYRGTALGPAYVGRYFFGDFIDSMIWSLGLNINPDTGEATAGDLVDHTAELGGLAKWPVSFGVDLHGELYLLDYVHGSVSRILPGAPCPPAGCVSPHVPNDFNHDGHPDLAMRDYQTGANVIWLMDGASVSSVVALPSVPDVAWKLSATADVNGDGWPDLIWRHSQTGADVAWLMNGTTVLSVAVLPTVTDVAWRLVAAADMDGDGTDDVIWRHNQTGATVIWYLRSAAFSSSATLPVVPDRAWQLVAAGDVDGDGHPDLVWRNSQTGENLVWFMNNATIVNQVGLPAVPDRTWQLVGAVDVNGDGKADLAWRNTVTGQTLIWFLDGSAIAGTEAFPPITSPTIRQPGPPPPPVASDFDRDAWSDLLWRNDTTGQNQVWNMHGAHVVSAANLLGETDTNWQIVGTTDFDGDGHPDLIWRNAATGANVVWYLSGTSVVSVAELPPVADLQWHLAGTADLDGDGHPDLLWRNRATGENAVWYMANPASPVSVALTTVANLTWDLIGAADFDGDGYPDLLWRNTASGANLIWYMRDRTIVGTAALPTVSDLSWRLVEAFDVDRDGFPDLVWRNTTSGLNVVWYLRNATFISQESLPTVADTSWRLVR